MAQVDPGRDYTVIRGRKLRRNVDAVRVCGQCTLQPGTRGQNGPTHQPLSLSSILPCELRLKTQIRQKL